MKNLTDTLPRTFSLTSPWFAPFADLADQLLRSARASSVADALNAARVIPEFTFVPQSELPAHEAYEAFISRTRQIPTRDNLHDLFNGLMWLTYPHTKRRLHQLQATEISRHGISARRGPLRDALTLFDENALLLHAPTHLIEALRQRAWRSLFVERRDEWQRATARIFGHALLEKLTQPRKPITAHVWIVSSLSDEAIAATLIADHLQSRAFLPLPVLGIPGWWPENEDSRFYEDEDVFRPASRRNI